MTSSLSLLRRRAFAALVVLLWVAVPLAAGTAWATGASVPLTTGLQVALALVSTLAWRAGPDAAWARATAGAGVVGIAAILVFAAAGTAYQIDMHMTFFVALAVVAAMACIPSLITAAGAAAVHHLSLNLLVPLAVFPDGADLARVLLHAVVVVFETAALVALALGVSRALTASDTAAETARQAQTIAAEAAQARIRAEEAAQIERRRILLGLADDAEREIGRATEGVAIAADAVTTASRLADTQARKSQTHASEAAEAAVRAQEAAMAMASAVEEIVASTRELDQHAHHTAQTARAAAIEGARGRTVAERLAQEARQADGLLKAIGEITSRTTVLALNASIEATRAGQAGHGFAIVANEVKDLAAKTAQTAKEVARRIQRITEGSAEVHAAATTIETRLSALAEDAHLAADALAKQTQTGQQIARGIVKASRDAEAAAVAAQASVQAATAAAQASTKVASSLLGIAHATSDVRQGLERFVAGIRNG